MADGTPVDEELTTAPPGSSCAAGGDVSGSKTTHMTLIGGNNYHILPSKPVIFGFPLNLEAMQILSYCTLYTKYYDYLQCLLKNKVFDIYAYPMQLKRALEIEYNICKNGNSGKTYLNTNWYMIKYR